MKQKAAVKALLVVAVMAAFHASLLLAARPSIAGVVNELRDPTDLSAGMVTDEPTRALHEFARGRNLNSASPSELIPVSPENYDDAHTDIWFYIQGVAVTFDEVVARSYRTGLASTAKPEREELPGIGDGAPSMAEHNVKRAGADFYEHVKSVSEAGFSQRQLLQVDEWDARDFRPPEWAEKLRDAVRGNDPVGPAGPNDEVPASSRPARADTGWWIVESMKLFTYVQTQLQTMDPEFLVILGIVGVPCALLGIARSTRSGSRPSRAARAKQAVTRPLVKVHRKRRRRNRIRIRRVHTENRL